MGYRIVFLRPKKITRFLIQDGFYSEVSLKYIPSDYIYTLYLSNLLERDFEFQKINKEKNLEKLKELYLRDIPKISSAYPYYIENNEIYLYLPGLLYKYQNREVKNKKIRNSLRDYNKFVEINYLNSIIENIKKGETEQFDSISDYSWAKILTRVITRNSLDRIRSSTLSEGGLFNEEYVFCYRISNRKYSKEFGYYFIIEENSKTEEFLKIIREYFELRGIGANKSVSNSVFQLATSDDILKDYKDLNLKEKEKLLYDLIEKTRKEGYLYHTRVLDENIKDKIEILKHRFLVIDGFSIYFIISDGSKLKETVNYVKPIVVDRRQNLEKLNFRIFYGI
ncbi:MAG: hypothetical protein ACP5G1_03130 [Nanopusillaceae archaeon]